MQELSSQICAAHIELIAHMANAIDQSNHADVVPLIDRYREDGWTDLSHALSAWLEGKEPQTEGLDDEDTQIIAGIQQALAEPAWLDSLADQARQEAAGSIAALIFAGTWGDHDALEALAHMREAAREAGLKHSAAEAFVDIVEGERDVQKLIDQHTEADPELLRAVMAQFNALEEES